MAGSVIVAGARTPIGKLSGALGGVRRHRPRWLRHQGRPRAGRGRARPGRLRVHGPGAAGRRRPDHRPPGRGQRRHPHDRARHHRQQGVPVGPQHHLPGRPDDPGRRGRHRRRRWHGVDDQGAVPAPGRPRRLPARRQDRRRLDDVRRPVLRLRPGGHGRRHREVRRVRRPRARARRTTSPPSRTSGPRPPSRRAASPTRSSPVEVPQRKGDPIVVDTDEGVRPGTTVESLGGLRPAFDKAGNITAGNASQISDGGAAVVVASKAAAERLGADAARRDRRLRPGGRARPVAAHPAVAGDQRRARAGRQVGRRHRPVRAQRGLRRRRPRLDGTTSASPTRSSTSTAAPSPSATRSACRAPAWRSRCCSS